MDDRRNIGIERCNIKEITSNKVTSGNVSHIVKEVFLTPDPSIKVVPKKEETRLPL